MYIKNKKFNLTTLFFYWHEIVLLSQKWGMLHTHSLWSIFTGDLPTHTHTGLFSRATCPHILTLVYFHGRPAHTRSQWSIFKGDQPTHSQTSLFSRATCPHTHTGLFHGRPAHTYSLWSIFTSDLPTHSHWSIFTGDLPTHTHYGLFSRATCPHILTLVYFHGRPALLIGLTWDPIWRSPLTRTKIGV